MPTLTIPIPPLEVLFPSATAAAVLYAIYGYVLSRRNNRTKVRSEESRSPPRRGRKLERVASGLDLTLVPDCLEEKRQAEEIEQQVYLASFPDLENLQVTKEEQNQVKEDKRLYHMLQNLEDYPESVALARTRLLALLDQTLSAAHSAPEGTILPLSSPSQLSTHFASAHRNNSLKYSQYLSRRKAGGPRELFPTREYAAQWLKLAGGVKYVDGIWVGSVLSSGMSRRGGGIQVEREAAKLAWQVISEEFGDGDLEKNHVYVYHNLLSSLSTSGSSARGDAKGFEGLAEDGGSPRAWSAAIAQQCVGLLSSPSSNGDDFFPEALGFNMAYETLPYHLLVTSYELRELRIDDYYFALHISIDNPDTGHAAMARLAVERYLDGVRLRDGEEAMERMWRRVKAGVILADGLATTPAGPREFGWDSGKGGWRVIESTPIPSPQQCQSPNPSPVENQMVQLLIRKSTAAEHLHCPSRLSFGPTQETLEQWLNPSLLNPARASEFLRVLADKKPWIVKGDEAKSRLVRELMWGGRMFGAFTDGEVKVVRAWIESMGMSRAESGYVRGDDTGRYEKYIGEEVRVEDEVVQDRNTNSPSPTLIGDSNPTGPFSLATRSFLPSPSYNPSITTTPHCLPDIASLPPHLQAALLYTHLSLLDLFPLHPAKFASPLGSVVLRIIRAQLGFPALHNREDGCSGTDEVDLKGLWETANTHFRSSGEDLPEDLEGLARMVDADPTMHAEEVGKVCAYWLGIRLRPYANERIIKDEVKRGMGMWGMFGDGVTGRIARDIDLALRDWEALE